MTGHVLFQARRFESARAALDQAIVMPPQFWITHNVLASVLERLGDSRGALEAAQRATELSGGNSLALCTRGYVLARFGGEAEAREVAKDLERAARVRFVPPYNVALLHAGLGDREAAFAWLDKALVARDPRLFQVVTDARWDPYRSDPRFADLLRRCGFVTTTAN